MNLADMESGPSVLKDFSFHNSVASASLQIRMGFLRKVYGILSAQLLLTAAVAACFMVSDTVKVFVQSSPTLLVGGFILTLVVLLALMAKRKEVPTNYFLLGIFTILEAYTVGVAVTFYEVSSVLLAIILTATISVALTLYTFQTKRDFSKLGSSLFVALWILIMAGIVQAIFRLESLDLLIGVAGAGIFSLFIVFDTWLMLRTLSPEEYILASINLYLDIINLFLEILRLIGAKDRG